MNAYISFCQAQGLLRIRVDLRYQPFLDYLKAHITLAFGLPPQSSLGNTRDGPLPAWARTPLRKVSWSTVSGRELHNYWLKLTRTRISPREASWSKECGWTLHYLPYTKHFCWVDVIRKRAECVVEEHGFIIVNPSQCDFFQDDSKSRCFPRFSLLFSCSSSTWVWHEDV